MRRLLLWLGLVLGPVLAFEALAQTVGPVFRRIDVMDGLPANATSALALDQEGYLWIGTRDGLARYDGIGYRTYRYVPGDEGSLQGNYVFALWVDSKNRVWVGTEGKGLSMLDTDRRAFRHYRPDTHPLITNGDVMAVIEDRRGNIWFGTYGGGLYRIDKQGGLTRFLPKPGNDHSLPSANVLSLVVDAGGSLWVGTDNGLASWGTQGFERISPTLLSGSIVYSMYSEEDGSLWIGTTQGLDRRFNDGRIERSVWKDVLGPAVVMSMLRDRQGMRWLMTNKGVLLETKRGLELMKGNTVPGMTLAAQQDDEGGIWFATLSDGLRRLPPGWRNFSLTQDLGPTRSGQRRLAFASRRRGGFWVGMTWGGIEYWDAARGKVEVRLAGDQSRFPGEAFAVVERRDGSVWSSGRDVLQRYDPASGQVRRWYSRAKGGELIVGGLDQMVETENGLLWISAYGSGLQALDADGAIRHVVEPGDGHGLDMGSPEQIAVGPDRALWLANQHGLYRWHPGVEQFEPIPGSPKDRIFGFQFVAPDTLWLHRMGRLEAYRWRDGRLQLYRSFGAKQAVPAVESGGLVVDGRGRLCLPTTRGLLRYDPKKERARMFGVSDGLPSQELELLFPPWTLKEHVFASSAAGMVMFEPDRIGEQEKPSRLVLDSLSLRRGDARIELPIDTGRIDWLPGDRDLAVSARLLAYTNPGAHRYRFWLHGYDTGWVETGAQGERVFSSLEPGGYRLEVSATGTSGEWSAPKSFDIVVHAPWWRTVWAKAVAALVLLSVLWLAALAYRARLREKQANALREQKRELSERASEAKTHFLATLGHEIRTPMTGVLGMTDLLLAAGLPPRQQAQAEAIRRSGQHLLRLMNDSLDLSRIEAGKLDLQDVAFDVRALLSECADMLSPLAVAKGLAFSLQCAPDLPQALRGDADRVRQILLNLGNNAIKFTERGEVALRGLMTDEGLVIEVSDTGPGLNEEQKSRLFRRFEQAEGAKTTSRYGGSGLGLAICRELTAAMGGHIGIVSQPREGTTFRVLLPLPAAELADVAVPVTGPRAPRQALRILVVEDDPTVVDVVTGLLQNLGHETEHAAQGLDALARLSMVEFDVAFVDLDLPGLDGFDVARLIRANGHGLPLLALTARADADAEPQAFAAGMNGFLRKPVLSAMLDEAIRDAVSTPAPCSEPLVESH